MEKYAALQQGEIVSGLVLTYPDIFENRDVYSVSPLHESYTNRFFARPYNNAQTSEIHKLFEGMSCMMYVIIVSYVFVRPHANSKWAFWKNSNSTRILFQISAFLVAENHLWRVEGMLKRRKKISVFISGRGLRINLSGPSSSRNAISYGNLINLSLGCDEFNRTWIIVTAQNVLTSIMFRFFFFFHYHPTIFEYQLKAIDNCKGFP